MLSIFLGVGKFPVQVVVFGNGIDDGFTKELQRSSVKLIGHFLFPDFAKEADHFIGDENGIFLFGIENDPDVFQVGDDFLYIQLFDS